MMNTRAFDGANKFVLFLKLFTKKGIIQDLAIYYQGHHHNEHSDQERNKFHIMGIYTYFRVRALGTLQKDLYRNYKIGEK